MGARTNNIILSGTIKQETARAYLVDFGGDEPVWLPKSQIEVYGDDVFSVPKWLADEKGIS